MNTEELDFLTGLVRTRAGVVLGGEKGYFAQSRLAPLARHEGAASVEDLIANLREVGDERLIQATVEAMTIADTAFFRDGPMFNHLRDVVIPELAAARPDGHLYIWSAGCSTGQEAYSLSMLVDQARAKVPNLSVDIIGTDLSRRALEKAHSGLYTQFEVQRGLPIRMLLEHFERAGDMWRANDRLRQSIRWRQLNLLDDRRSVRPFDLVLCRNVVGSFEAETSARVLEQMSSALASDGYLVMGRGEANVSDAYEATNPGLGLYRRSHAAKRVAA
ncbi:MAG: CheR family methyltransferase [Caulobacteraceae bacterium]